MGQIAILGGTAGQGLGLALRLAAAGEAVVIGSRARERAIAAAQDVASRVPGARVDGCENELAAARADRIILAFPAEGVTTMLPGLAASLAGKLVIDVMVPLAFRRGRAEIFPVDGAPSLGEFVQAHVPSARVVGAFKSVPAEQLEDLEARLAGDVLVCGDDERARAEVADLVGRIPSLRAVDAGGLANTRYVEGITALLINLNRLHKATTSISIVGL